jgi:hypothetical protein
MGEDQARRVEEDWEACCGACLLLCGFCTENSFNLFCHENPVTTLDSPSSQMHTVICPSTTTNS